MPASASSLGCLLSAPHQNPRSTLRSSTLIGSGSPHGCHQHHHHQHLQARHYRTPKPIFHLPKEVAEVVEAAEAARPMLPDPHVPPPAPKPMQATSRRVGCMAVKAGMTQEWDEHGVRVPLTVLWIDECQVVGMKFPERNGYWALQTGAGHKKMKAMDLGQAGFYIKQGVPFKKLMVEWPVTEDAVLPVGTSITAAHFVAGQRVDVVGYTKDKGFQGVMKRWGFKGLPASHGVSLSHRAPGAIGGRQDPGKVYKGKKLPGQMGDERRTVHNCLVYKIDPARGLLYIRGQVPGEAGRMVYLRDAYNVTHEFRSQWNLPFPTFVGETASLPVSVYRSSKDPYRMYREETDYFPVEWKKTD